MLFMGAVSFSLPMRLAPCSAAASFPPFLLLLLLLLSHLLSDALSYFVLDEKEAGIQDDDGGVGAQEGENQDDDVDVDCAGDVDADVHMQEE